MCPAPIEKLTPEILRCGRTETLAQLRQITLVVIENMRQAKENPRAIAEQNEIVNKIDFELRRRDPDWNPLRYTN